jgi:hypothetical protein
MAGLAFAASSWGWDGYLLSQSHAYYPWNVLIVGAILCGIAGGIAGWFTSRIESSLFGIPFWILAAIVFAWCIVTLPLRTAPLIASMLDPQLGSLLNYSRDIEFAYRFGVALAWVIPFALLAGVIQLPIVEPAVFSTSIFGRIAPSLFCAMVLGIAGIITDGLINESFRGAITSLDNTIQFVVDNKGNEHIDAALSRQVHARALETVKEDVQEARSLFVGGFDETLGEFNILVKFGDTWVTCEVFYNQPINCGPAIASP